MKPLKMGVVGVGGMGGSHIKGLAESEFVQVAALADLNQELLDKVSAEQGAPGYRDAVAMMDSGNIEAVLIAVPHPFHAQLAIAAAERGLHVLSEKPISVTVDEADAMIAAAKKAGVLLGINFQRRLAPAHQKIRELLDNGTVGQVYEIQMISNNWYRLQSYYDSGAWRGTWKGEGGGILANQAPHNLDLLRWFGGAPSAVKASVTTRLHKIETENTVHAILEYPGGANAYYTATTSDPLGKSSLQILGDNGRIVLEGRSVRLGRYPRPISDHILNAQDKKTEPFEVEWEELSLPEPEKALHTALAEQFARAVRLGEPLVATGEDGREALELANAMHLSGYTHQRVALPVDREAVSRLFDALREGRSAREELA